MQIMNIISLFNAQEETVSQGSLENTTVNLAQPLINNGL